MAFALSADLEARSRDNTDDTRQEQAYYPDSSARPKFFFCHVDRDKETHGGSGA
jgi:hypothetical protein